MRYDRLPFIRIDRGVATGKEGQVGAVGQMVFDLMKKLAHANAGKIFVRIGRGTLLHQAERHLFNCIGRVSQSDDRYIRHALVQLEQVGLIVLSEGCIELPGWKEIAAIGRGGGVRTCRAFRTCFIHESPSFAALPMMTRAFAHQLLRIAGDDGALLADPISVMHRLGWGGERHIRERDLISGWMAELLADGYLVPHPALGSAWLAIKNFARFQPPLAPEDELDSPPTSHRRPTDVPLTSHRLHTENTRNPAESFKTASGDRSIDRSDQIPPNPPLAGGGSRDRSQAELFPTSPIPARAAQKRYRPVVPAGGKYPPWFERLWTMWPGRLGSMGSKPKALAEASKLRDELGEDGLEAKLRDYLGWRMLTAEWRRPDPPIPDFHRLLRDRIFETDQRPSDPRAFADPVAPRSAPRDFDGERIAAEKRREEERLKAERRRADEAKRKAIAEAAATPSPLQVARERALDRTDFRDDPTCSNLRYLEPETTEVQAIWHEVMAQRIPAFRAAHPAMPLPRIMREYLAHHPDREPRPPAPPPAPAAPAAPAAKRSYIPAGTWPPSFAEPREGSYGNVTALRLVGKPGPIDGGRDPAEVLEQLQHRSHDIDVRLRLLERRSATGG